MQTREQLMKRIPETSRVEGVALDDQKFVPLGTSFEDDRIPNVGDRVYVRVNDIGNGVVIGHFAMHGYLGVIVGCDKAPSWATPEQRECATDEFEYVVEVFGAEITLLEPERPVVGPCKNMVIDEALQGGA